MIRTICEQCKELTFYDFNSSRQRHICGCFNTKCIDFEEKNYCVNIDEELECIILERLGFCGCGLPEDAIIFIKAYIDLLIKHNDERDE
jgi:hypothetical protein